MEYIFQCSTRYLTKECSERVRYKVEHESRYSISTSNHVLFCLLYSHTDDDVFDDFPKIPQISEGNRKLPKTFEENPEMFRLYTNKFKRSLRVKHDHHGSEIIDIFTSEDMENTPPASRL